MHKVKLMNMSVRDNGKANLLLNNTNNTQIDIEFKYDKYKIRGKIDGSGIDDNGKHFIFDLKTTNEIEEHSYTRQLIKLMYHLQASIYVKGYFHKHGIIPNFYHLVIENKEPYKINVVKINQDWINLGDKIFKKLIEDFKYCEELDLWHMGTEFYKSNIEELKLPEWYENSINDE